MSDDPQVPLFIDTPAGRQRVYKISRSSGKARKKATGARQTPLGLKDREIFEPGKAPRTRAECPTERPCNRIHCRWNLAMEDAEHRAGRPGLANVPRDERGLTMAVDGCAGEERPGMTFRPIWREYERTCRVQLTWDEAGNVCEVLPLVPVTSSGTHIYFFRKKRVGTWDMVEDRLHPGERLEVYDDTETLVASAFYMPDGTLCFDRNPYAVSVTLVRVRGVSSCALDEIDKRGVHTNEQTGDAVGRHRTLIGREVRRALDRAKKAAKDMFGMTEAELLEGLRQLREDR